MQDERENHFRLGAVILAAGQSRRMGRPKLLLPWGTETVLAHLIRQWEILGAAQIAAVTAPEAEPLNAELRRLSFPDANRILNPHPERGMFSSIQCAAAWRGWDSKLAHFLITLGDQPHLRRATLEQLLNFAAVHPERICQPLRNGNRRHPVIFPRRWFLDLANSSAENLKEFLQHHEHALAGFESDDSGLDLDMDTPEDYERLRSLPGLEVS